MLKFSIKKILIGIYFQTHFIPSLTIGTSKSGPPAFSKCLPYISSATLWTTSFYTCHVDSIFCFSRNFLARNFLFSSTASLKSAHHSSRSISTLLLSSRFFSLTTHPQQSLPPSSVLPAYTIWMPAFPTTLRNLEAEMFHSSFKVLMWFQLVNIQS